MLPCLQVSVLSMHPLLLPPSSLCLPVCLISLPLSSPSAIFQSFLTCFSPMTSVSVLFRASFPISLSLLYALIAVGMGEVSRWVCWDKAFLMACHRCHHRCHHSLPPQPYWEPVTSTSHLPCASPLFPSFTGLEIPEEGALHTLFP